MPVIAVVGCPAWPVLCAIKYGGLVPFGKAAEKTDFGPSICMSG